MTMCPFCRKVMTPTEAESGVCPKCGNNLPFRKAEGTVDDPSTPSATVSSSKTINIRDVLGSAAPPAQVGGDDSPNRTIPVPRPAPPMRSFGAPVQPAPSLIPPLGAPTAPEGLESTLSTDRARGGGQATPGRTLQMPPSGLGSTGPGALPPETTPIQQSARTIQVPKDFSALSGLTPPPSMTTPAAIPPSPGGVTMPAMPQSPRAAAPGSPLAPPGVGSAPPSSLSNAPAGRTIQIPKGLSPLPPLGGVGGPPAQQPLNPMQGSGARTITVPQGDQSFSGSLSGFSPLPPSGLSGAGQTPGAPPTAAGGGGNMTMPVKPVAASNRTIAVSDIVPGGLKPPGSSAGGPGAPQRPAGFATVPGGGLMQPPPASPPSLPMKPPSAGQTIVSRPLPGGIIPGGDSSSGRTVDDQIAGAWNTVAGQGVKPGMTIKGSQAKFSPTKSHLVVRTRAVSDSRWIKTKSTKIPGDVPHELAPDYELMDLLGEGGMGVVYAARQASIDRVVAIKMLKPEMAQDLSLRAKFLTEAAVTGDLDHPNIVAIHELGSAENGSLFYSMRRVRGTPWLEVIRQKTLTENLEIWMKVADAIAFAHSRGVLHRDLKPENVMLGDFGEALVMDWGLALSVRDNSKAESIHTSDCLAGTPAYMSPEMALGPVTTLGFHSDVYLLGAILYEVVTGSPPHSGETATECLYAVGKNIIQPTEKKGELIDICLRAMSTDPNLRHPSVLDLQATVRQYQSHSESVALSTRADEDLTRGLKSRSYDDLAQSLFGFKEAYSLWDGNIPAKEGVSKSSLAYAQVAYEKTDLDLAVSLLSAQDPSHKSLLKTLQAAKKERDARQARLKTFKRVVVGMAAVIVIGLIAGLYAINEERNAAILAESEAVEAKKNTEIALLDAQDARDKAVASEGRAKEAEGQAKTSAIAATDAANLAKAAEGEAKKEKAAADKARDAAVIAKREAEISEANAQRLKRESDRQAYLALVGLTAEKVSENNHGQARENLAICRPDLRQWEWGRLWYECQLHAQSFMPSRPEPVNSVGLSRMGNYAATAGWGGAYLWNATPIVSSEPMLIDKPLAPIEEGLDVLAVRFSPDSEGPPRWLATVTEVTENNRKSVKLWEINWQNPAKPVLQERPIAVGPNAHKGAVLDAIFSPDGKLLLTCGVDRRARLWDVASGELRAVLSGHYDAVTSAAFSAAGDFIVTVSLDGSANVWYRQGNEFRYENPLTFRGHVGPIYAVAISPDGRVATAGADKTAIVWRPSDKANEPGKETEFDFEKFLNPDKLDRDVTQLGRRIMLTGHRGPVRSVAFSPDHEGRYVLTASDDNTVRLWDVRDVDIVQMLDGQTATEQQAGAVNHTLRDTDHIRVQGRVQQVIRGHGSSVRSAVFSADGKRILTGSYDKEAKVWDREHYIDGKRVLAWHDGSILAGAFSGTGARMITASKDGSAAVWNTADGKRERVLAEGHDYLVSTVGISDDGQRVITGAGDSTVRVWSLGSGAQIFSAEGTGRSGAAAISGDGTLIVTGGGAYSERTRHLKVENLGDDADREKKAYVWQVDKPSDKPLELVGHAGKVSAVAISPKGDLVLTGDERGRSYLWDAKTGKQLQAFAQHGRKIAAVAFGAMPDGQLFALTAGDRVVRCYTWNAETTERKFEVRLMDNVTAIAVSNQYLLTGANDGRAQIWTLDGKPTNWQIDADTKRATRTDENEAKTQITSVAFAKDGQRAVVVSSDNRVRVWALKGGAWVDGDKPVDLRTNDLLAGVSRQLPAWSAAFTPDGGQLITGGGRDAQLWTLEGERPKLRTRFAAHGAVSGVAAIPVKKVLGQPAPEGGVDIAATVSWDRGIKLWNLADGKALAEVLDAHARNINSVAFSPDGARLVTAGDDKFAYVWDIALENGQYKLTKSVTVQHDDRVRSAVFSPDGQMLLTASDDRSAQIWDAKSGEPLYSFDGKQGHAYAVLFAEFSPDGALVATTGEDNLAKIWEVPAKLVNPAGKLEKVETEPTCITLQGHSAFVNHAAFSPDSQRLLTASDDGTAKLWLWDFKKEAKAAKEAQAGENAEDKSPVEKQSDPLGAEILTLTGHTAGVTSVGFAPDGRTVFTAGQDGKAFLWPTRDWKGANAAAAAPKTAPLK